MKSPIWGNGNIHAVPWFGIFNFDRLIDCWCEINSVHFTNQGSSNLDVAAIHLLIDIFLVR